MRLIFIILALILMHQESETVMCGMTQSQLDAETTAAGTYEIQLEEYCELN